MIRAWRLTRRVHATPPADAFRGIGAELFGGRWNHVGTPATYVASSRALAALEYLANVDPADVPSDLVFAQCTFDEADIERADPPIGWDAVDPIAAQNYGDAWLRSRTSLALAVPSVIVTSESNYVLNPAHSRAHTLVIGATLEDFVYDARLLKR